jgi:hypothetical protein
MSCVTEKKELNGACSGCCNNCKNKKIEKNIKLLPVETQNKNNIKE